MKDAYYFPHDSNAKDDPKCVLLIEQLGMEGYGIYWMLVETLRDQPNYKYPLTLLPALARRYNTTPEKVRTVVASYGLFEIEEDNIFFSRSLLARMQRIDDRRKKLSEAGRRGNEKRWNIIATQSPPDDHAIATQSQVKESKVKEIKEKKVFIIPTIEEISNYCRERNSPIDPAVFHDHYTSNGWMVGKVKMRDWKASVRTWERNYKEKSSAKKESYGKHQLPTRATGCSFLPNS